MFYWIIFSVVERVLKRTPLLFEDKVIEVEAHMPDALEESNPDVKNTESDTDCFAVHVSGFDTEKISEETLILYFESRKVGDADIIYSEKAEENAYILKFKDEEGNILYYYFKRIAQMQQHKCSKDV